MFILKTSAAGGQMGPMDRVHATLSELPQAKEPVHLMVIDPNEYEFVMEIETDEQIADALASGMIVQAFFDTSFERSIGVIERA